MNSPTNRIPVGLIRTTILVTIGWVCRICLPALILGLLFGNAVNAVAADSTARSPLPKIISATEIPPPTAQFGLRQRRIFSYVQEVDSLFLPAEPNSRSAALAGGLNPYPLHQRILCQGLIHRDSSITAVISKQAKMFNVRSRVSRKIPSFRQSLAIAYIDAGSGQIRRVIHRDSLKQQVPDTLDAASWEFSSTLWEFYGTWMLHLADSFFYQRVVNYPLAGIIQTTLVVEGRQSIGEHECFIVRFAKNSPGHRGIVKTYWVDVEDRVTRRVQDEQIVMKFFSPATPSGENSPPPPPNGDH